MPKLLILTLLVSLTAFTKSFEIDKIKDLGELKPNQQVTVIFKGKNTGDKILEITKVKTACACMTTEINKLSVPVGKEFNIPLTFSTGKMTGNINKSVSLSLKGHKFPVFLRVKASVASVEGEKKAKQLVPQKTCPYKGSPIDTKLFVEYQGQKIYVCCEPCLKVVEKNPIEAVERLRDLYGEKIR